MSNRLKVSIGDYVLLRDGKKDKIEYIEVLDSNYIIFYLEKYGVCRFSDIIKASYSKENLDAE